jgi:hypothetical protein
MMPLAAPNTLTQEENADHRGDLDSSLGSLLTQKHHADHRSDLNGSLGSFQNAVDTDSATEILLIRPPQSQRSHHDEVLATQVDDAVHGGTFGFANIINSKDWQLRLMMWYKVVPFVLRVFHIKN